MEMPSTFIDQIRSALKMKGAVGIIWDDELDFITAAKGDVDYAVKLILAYRATNPTHH